MRQLFMVILSLSLSGTLVGILITVIHPLTGKYFSKKWNYYIWLLVIVRLMLPFHLETDFLSALNFCADISLTEQNTADNFVAKPAASAKTAETITNASGESAYVLSDSSTSGAQDIANTSAQKRPEPKASDTSLSDTIFSNTKLFDTKFSAINILTSVSYLWFFGALIALFITISNYFRFRAHIRKDCVRITDCRLTLMENTYCARLGIQEVPAICESSAVASPLTIGLWNPVIVIPKGLSDTLLNDERNLTQFQMVLHHELIHVARKDLLYKWVYRLLLCIHWFNPFLHYIGRHINSDCELSCDEEILADLTDAGKQMYGNILLDAAAQNIHAKNFPHNAGAFSTTLLENKSDLKKRLNGILHYKKSTRFRLILSVCIFIAALTLTACSSVRISMRDTAVRKADTDASEADSTDADESGLLTKVLGSMISADTFLNNVSEPKKSGDAWNVFDDDALLAGKDVQDNWSAYNYSGGQKKINASGFALYGSESILIVYANKDIDVKVSSSFDIVEGKFKIVHIMPDESILTMNDTGAESTQTITMKKGRNVIKMVGQGAKLKELKFDYSNLKNSDFEKVYYSEDYEYAAQLMNSLKSGKTEKTIDKDKIMNCLYYMEPEDVSDIFNTLLINSVQFSDDELCDIFIYSNAKLSAKYLTKAIENGYMEPLSGKTISELMPYLDSDCQAELLMQIPLDKFYDVFEENIGYLNSAQIEQCLEHYINAGGKISYSQFNDLSPYLNMNTIKKLDELPNIR